MNIIRESLEDIRIAYGNAEDVREMKLLERSYKNAYELSDRLLKEFRYWSAEGCPGERSKIDVCGEIPYLANRCSGQL